MKRIRKIPFLLAAMSSLLLSCTPKSIAGNYGFQLGKEHGTHFGIFMKLTDKKYRSGLTIELSDVTKALHVNDEFTLTATPSKNETVNFIIRDKNVLEKVSDSKNSITLKGKNPGKTYVVAVKGDTSVRCRIAVFAEGEPLVEPDPYPDIEVDPRALKCTYSFSVKITSDGESIIETIISYITEEYGQDGKLSLPGYYYRTGKIAKNNELELKIGIDFTDLFAGIFDDAESIIDDIPEIGADAIEQIIYTTYKSGVVTLNVPVSEADVLYQLYWYGHNIVFTDEQGLEIIDLPPERCHAPGTHPTAEEIEEINTTYNYKEEHEKFSEEFNIDLGSYRDFYTLGMGLIKN